MDVALQDRDVWMVGRSQREALGEDLHVSKNGSRGDVLLRLGPAQHTFGDVTVQRFSFASDGGILHGQRSDWRWSFQDSRHRRLGEAWLLFRLRPANAGESCYLLQLGGSHHSVHSLTCQNLHIDCDVIAPFNAW